MRHSGHNAPFVHIGFGERSQPDVRLATILQIPNPAAPVIRLPNTALCNIHKQRTIEPRVR